MGAKLPGSSRLLLFSSLQVSDRGLGVRMGWVGNRLCQWLPHGTGMESQGLLRHTVGIYGLSGEAVRLEPSSAHGLRCRAAVSDWEQAQPALSLALSSCCQLAPAPSFPVHRPSWLSPRAG